ncbi:hypothetical protein GCM10025886_11270 [Tetragenococcus halophilus subsp. flandriensis]|nr:hypothetical protein GCM10025886_11270 [Tetragenococcus halophilus subsp. flandriensis]
MNFLLNLFAAALLLYILAYLILLMFDKILLHLKKEKLRKGAEGRENKHNIKQKSYVFPLAAGKGSFFSTCYLL